MRRVAGLFLTGQFGRFLLVGACAAGANFLSRFGFQQVMGYWAAVTAAFLVGFATAFVLNRLFVFPSTRARLRRELSWFFLFNALAFPVVVGASVGLSHLFGHVVQKSWAEAAAHGIAIMLPVFVNFLAHKFITFGPGSTDA